MKLYLRICCVFVLLAFVLSSCSNSAGTKFSKHVVAIKLSATEQGKLELLAYQYFELKNALVASDAVATKSAAQQIITAADSMQAALAADSINMKIILPFLDTIKNQATIITMLNDNTCERQRLVFSPLSNALYAILTQIDSRKVAIYQQYCPMALNEKGAYWLSSDREIKNPYFGKKMLECGEVTDSL